MLATTHHGNKCGKMRADDRFAQDVARLTQRNQPCAMHSSPPSHSAATFDENAVMPALSRFIGGAIQGMSSANLPTLAVRVTTYSGAIQASVFAVVNATTAVANGWFHAHWH